MSSNLKEKTRPEFRQTLESELRLLRRADCLRTAERQH